MGDPGTSLTAAMVRELTLRIDEIEAGRPPIDRVLVTRVVPPGECLMIHTRRWLLIAPGDMAQVRAESRKTDSHVPGMLFGLQVEDVPPGSARELEILFLIGNALSWAPAADPAP